jgi:hypothetical protein
MAKRSFMPSFRHPKKSKVEEPSEMTGGQAPRSPSKATLGIGTITVSPELQHDIFSSMSDKEDDLTMEGDEDDAPIDLKYVRSILTGQALDGDDGNRFSSMDDRALYGRFSSLGEDSQHSAPAAVEQKSVTWTGIDSPASSRADSTKTRDELIAKIEKLKSKLRQAQIDHSAEKTIRRKKERNLVKLAKELNKRANNDDDRDKEVKKVRRLDHCCSPSLESSRLQ